MLSSLSFGGSALVGSVGLGDFGEEYSVAASTIIRCSAGGSTTVAVGSFAETTAAPIPRPVVLAEVGPGAVVVGPGDESGRRKVACDRDKFVDLFHYR